jgi:hypothetical protein
MTAIMSANDLGDENYLELEWACSLTFLYLKALTTLHPGLLLRVITDQE